jgi:hypothetical protein
MLTQEKKAAGEPALAAPVRPTSSTRQGTERQAPGYQSPKVSTLLPAGRPATPLVSAKVLADEIDLSNGILAMPADIAASVEEGREIDVKVRLPGLAQGNLRLRRRGGHFSSTRDQAVLFSHPALAGFTAAVPTMLVLRVADDVVTGWVGLGAPGSVRGSAHSLFDAMAKAKAGDLLGWAGLSGITIPAFRNQFANGAIDVRAEKLLFTVGGFLSGTGSAALDNQSLSFAGSAKVQIPGDSGGDLQIKKDPTGALFGTLGIQVNVGKVAGNVTATLTGGFVNIMGSVAYTDDRLSGKITLVAVDEVTARDITLKKPEAGAEVPIELPGPDKPVKPGRRAYAGWGQLTFRITDWLAGTATVIVNSKGQATIIGEIAPPKEFPLFDGQKEWIKRIVKVEIRAGYGIPVVGEVGLFANISLDAIAKIGPGKLYNIKLSGAYSTDPRVPKQLSIEGTINISAFAGLRARAEAGLVVTILAHDIKAGVGLIAIAGVRGYVEAIPRIGMREPTPGKRQYYIQGHFEIAAQPVLGFGGDLFVAIETPWWSPLSDHRWTWPLFNIEYPLPGEFGIGADVDYVLGSRQWPKIEFGEVNFDSSKFLTDVLNDNTDSGRGGEEQKRGEWQEGIGGGGPGGAKNKGGTGKAKKGPEDGEDIGPIGENLTFSDGRESHRLWIEEKDADSTTMLSSEGGKVEFTLRKWSEKFDIVTAYEAGKARDLLNHARLQNERLSELADNLAHRKQAAKNAQAYYKKYGSSKKGVKGDKSKKDLKKAKAEARAAQRELERTVEQLAKIIVTMPFLPLVRPAFMHGGTEKVEIVARGIAVAIHIADSKLAVIFLQLLGGPIGRAINKAAERLVRQAWNDLEHTGKEVGKTRIKNGQVNVHAYQSLLTQIGPITAIVSRIGRQLRIHNLARAQQVLPLQPATAVDFVAHPQSPGGKLYSTQFIAELHRQLRDQQHRLNQITVDRWFANLALFKMDHDRYLQLDSSARETVRQELIKRTEAARVRTKRTLDRVEKQLLDVLAKGTTHGFQGEIVSRRVRAQQRKEAAQAAWDELQRAEREDDMPKPELVRPRYPGLQERMKVGIGGRSDKGTREARRNYVDEVIKLLGTVDEWQELGNDASKLAVLHRPDQVAGGYDEFPVLVRPEEGENRPDWRKYLAALHKMFGRADVNSKIGSEWSRRITGAFTSVKSQVVTHEAQPINRLNLRLNVR